MEQGARIVLVESNPTDVRWFRLAIEGLRPEPALTVVDGGPNTLQQIRELLPDVIVSAWRLPFYEAPELIEATRAIPALKNVPIAVLTMFPKDPKELESLGILRWFTKPINAGQIEDLLALIKKRTV